jgi:hypothetical protein
MAGDRLYLSPYIEDVPVVILVSVVKPAFCNTATLLGLDILSFESSKIWIKLQTEFFSAWIFILTNQ